MKTNYWECKYHKFITQCIPKKDKNDKVRKGEFNIKCIFGCRKKSAPKGMINLCRMETNLLSHIGVCPI